MHWGTSAASQLLLRLAQAVAQELAAAQAKLVAAGDELHSIQSQAAHDAQQLTQARQQVTALILYMLCQLGFGSCTLC